AALNIAITDHDLRGFTSKRERRGPTDSRTSAGYQCDLVLKFFHRRISLLKILSGLFHRGRSSAYPTVFVLLPSILIRKRMFTANNESGSRQTYSRSRGSRSNLLRSLLVARAT